MAHILVAEDEHDIRELIQLTLSFGGHVVTVVNNGAEAVQKVAEARPDLIMLDVRMPKMSGYEACRAIKAMESFSRVPVVFLTAKGQDEEVQSGIEVGAAAYILKPFSPDDLNRRVTELLRQHNSSAGAAETDG
jgi:DNA-binding response OmpR family regulator